MIRDQLGAARLVKCSVMGTLCCDRCYSIGFKIVLHGSSTGAEVVAQEQWWPAETAEDPALPPPKSKCCVGQPKGK